MLFFIGTLEVITHLEMIFELVDDGTGGAEISILALPFGGHFEGALGFQVVLEGSYDVTTSGGQGREFVLGLRFVGQGCVG